MPEINRKVVKKKVESHSKGTHNREERQKIYNTTRWIRLRDAKLLEQPLCEICLAKGITKLATQVHHKDEFLNYEGTDRLWKAYDYGNLQSLCTECHTEIHNRRQKDGYYKEKRK